MSTAALIAVDALAHLRHQPLVRAADRRDDAELAWRRSPRSAWPPRPARGCRARPRAPGRGTGRTGSRSGSPRGSRRSSARRCPRPRPPGRTTAPHLVRQRQQLGEPPRRAGAGTASTCSSVRPAALVQHLLRGRPRMSRSVGCVSSGHGSRRAFRGCPMVCRNAAASKRPPKAGPRPARAAEQERRRVQRPGALRAARRRAAGPPASPGRGGCSASARSGSAGQEPMTRPASSRPRWAIASSVSAVWLSVPRPGRATSEHRGLQRVGEVGERRAVLVVADEQAAGALDERRGRRRSASSRDPVGGGVQVQRRQAAGRAAAARGERVAGSGRTRAGRSTPVSRRDVAPGRRARRRRRRSAPA